MKSTHAAIAALYALCFVLYANTLGHQFVLDDKIVITENSFTKEGIGGIADLWSHDSMTGFFGRDKNLVSGGRYRPLSMSMHAIEFEFFGLEPMPYHLLNILWYVGNVILLFLLLLALFPPGPGTAVWTSLPFLGAVLFALHPLHTEVVANIKSRDELMSIFFALWAFLILARGQTLRQHLAAGLLFGMSLLSKESSVVFIAIIPLVFYYVKGYKPSQALRTAATPAVFFLLYVAMRLAILGSTKTQIADEWMNNPFLHTDTADKFATIVYTLGLYLKLALWPHPLTHDYYPAHIPIMSWADTEVLISLILYSIMLIWAVVSLSKRQTTGLVIWVYFAGLALYCNVLFPIGTFMNERFLYVSTMGISVYGAFVLLKLALKTKNLAVVIGLCTFLLMGFKTIDRNRAWESDISLALKDVEVSENSAKCNMSAGGGYIERGLAQRNELLKNKDLHAAIRHLRRALEIYPTYLPALLLSGNAYTSLGNYSEGIAFYERTLQINPAYPHAITNLEYVAQEAGRKNQFEQVAGAYTVLIKYIPDKAVYYERLGEVIGRDLNNPEKSLPSLQKALELGGSNAEIQLKLGVANAMLGRLSEAKGHFKEGLSDDVNHGRLWFNLGILYQNMGQTDSAAVSLEKAFALEPGLRGPNQ